MTYKEMLEMIELKNEEMHTCNRECSDCYGADEDTCSGYEEQS